VAAVEPDARYRALTDTSAAGLRVRLGWVSYTRAIASASAPMKARIWIHVKLGHNPQNWLRTLDLLGLLLQRISLQLGERACQKHHALR
jgi:hypothetical protein